MVKISYIVCITGLETRQLQVFVFLEQARTLKQRQILTLDQYSHYTLTSSSPGPFKVQGQYKKAGGADRVYWGLNQQSLDLQTDTLDPIAILNSC